MGSLQPNLGMDIAPTRSRCDLSRAAAHDDGTVL